MAVTMAWDAIGFSMFSEHLSLVFLIKSFMMVRAIPENNVGGGGHRPEAY